MFIVTFSHNEDDVWTTVCCNLRFRQMLHTRYQSIGFVSGNFYKMYGLKTTIIWGEKL